MEKLRAAKNEGPFMPIKFCGSVTLSRENPVTGKLRYMPNLKFDIIGLDRVQFGLTIFDDADWPLNYGEEKSAHFTMLRNADLDADLFDKLADSIRAGTTFSLMEGARVVGSGVVQTIEERTHT